MRFGVLVLVLLFVVPLFPAINTQVVVAAPTTNSVPVKTIKQNRPRCEAITLSGNRCKRRAMPGCKYCRQHDAIIRKRAEKEEK